MRHSIRNTILLTISLIGLIGSNAFASNTGAKAIERIQITDAGVAYVRPVGLGPWGGNDCPNATYAYIGSTAAGYDGILNLMLASKLNGANVQFYGTCSSNGVYFLITYAHLK